MLGSVPIFGNMPMLGNLSPRRASTGEEPPPLLAAHVGWSTDESRSDSRCDSRSSFGSAAVAAAAAAGVVVRNSSPSLSRGSGGGGERRVGGGEAGAVPGEPESSNGAAKAWLVMEKCLQELPNLGRPTDATTALPELPPIEPLAPPKVAAAAEGASLDERLAAASERSRGHGNGNGGAAGAESSAPLGPREVAFREPLYSHGRVVGVLSGVLRVVDLPVLEQMHHGTLTENGVAFTGPLVIGDEAMKRTQAELAAHDFKGDGAARLGPLRLMLSRAIHSGHESARRAAAAELAKLLRVSHKESLVSFVFRDLTALYECRHQMLALWDMLLAGLESRALGFDARADCYLLIRLLLARAEIGCTLRDAASGGIGVTPLSHVVRWSILQQRTLAWILLVVGDPPAGGDGPTLRDFCAATMASCYFRLPQFGYALLTTLQSEEVLNNDVPEFRGITFSLDCADEAPLFAQKGLEEHPPLDWRRLHARVARAGANTATAAAAVLATSGTPRVSSSPDVGQMNAPVTAVAAASNPSVMMPAVPSMEDVLKSRMGSRLLGSMSVDSEHEDSLATAADAVVAHDSLLEETRRPLRRGQRTSSRNKALSGSRESGLDSTEALSPEEAAALQAAEQLLHVAMRQSAWRQRLRRRGHMFCRFFWEWMQVVCDSLESSTPPHFVAWSRLPGFKTQLICLLLELRESPVTKYSEPLVQLTNQLLRCTHLHSLLVKITFRKCSVHDVCAVSTTLNLIGSWMASLAARLQADAVRSRTELEAAPVSQPLLRSTFDFGFFFEGMCLIFESEHAQVLLKGIEFLYRHWDLLPEDQAIKLRGLILGDCYWRLLLHWAPAVRKFFAHLAVFRLCRPCMWSLDGYGALPELPPQLVVRFERRAMRLAQIAQAYTAHVAVAVAKGEAPSPSSVAPALAAASSVPAVVSSQSRKAVSESATTLQKDMDVPVHLYCYAPYAYSLVVELEETRTQLDAEKVRRAADAALARAKAALNVVAEAAPAAERSNPTASIELPPLHWDTSVLDMEEDRVIWVRESDLGKTTFVEP